ncbi:DUF1684 domain-containing protein [bacterium]|nr:MAG: DUF1684 domain-containing protein [bacterium]
MIQLLLSLALAAAASPLDDINKDRADTKKWLKSDPTSYLAAVNRVSFGDKPALTVGEADDNDIVLKGGGLKAHHLRLVVEGEKFSVTALDADATFTAGKDTTSVRTVKTAAAKIALGRYSLRLSHQGYPAVIVFDAKSPRFKEYKGIEYFKPDLKYRFIVKLVPDPAAEKLAIQSSNSADRKAERVGWFDFTVGTVPVRVAAHRLLEPGSGPDDISVFFRDLTTGKESYKVGRYVGPVKQKDGTYVLDFNMNYSPACAYSNFYNCPIPPKENNLKVAIRAGEKDSHYSH